MPQSPIYVETDEPDKIQKLTWTGTSYRSEIIDRSQLPAGANTRTSPPAAFHGFVADAASRYVSEVRIDPSNLPEVLTSVHSAFRHLAGAEPSHARSMRSEREIRDSITPDGIRSFLNGRVYKNLKRHLTIAGITPDQYRRSQGLPEDYPLIAPKPSKGRAGGARPRGAKPSRPRAATNRA